MSLHSLAMMSSCNFLIVGSKVALQLLLMICYGFISAHSLLVIAMKEHIRMLEKV